MKKNHNKKLLSSILAASAVVSSSGLAAVVGFLSEGSSYEAYAAASEQTWSDVIGDKLSDEKVGELANLAKETLGIEKGSGKDLLSNYSGLLKYADMSAILTDNNIDALKKYCEGFKELRSKQASVGELKADIKLPAPTRADGTTINLSTAEGVNEFVNNISSSFNADGTLKNTSDDGLSGNMCYNVLKSFMGEFGVEVGVGENGGMYLRNENGGDDKVDMTSVFGVVSDTAIQVQEGLNNSQGGNQDDNNQDNQGGDWVYTETEEEKKTGGNQTETGETPKSNDPNDPNDLGVYGDTEFGSQDEEMTSAGRLDPQEEAVSDEEVSAQKIGEEEVASEEKGSERSVDGGVRATKPVPDTGLESVMMLATLLAAISVVAAAKRSRD